MTLNEKYTTKEKKAKDPAAEKDKTEIGTDAFVVAELLESIFNKLEHLRISARTK